jgi:hypothetical protein
LETIDEPIYDALPSHTALQGILEGLLHGTKEWLVVTQLLLEEGKPRNLYAEHPDLFANVDEINTIRERVKERLQRNQSFRHYLQV